jgi:hypothetical protein
MTGRTRGRTVAVTRAAFNILIIALANDYLQPLSHEGQRLHRARVRGRTSGLRRRDGGPRPGPRPLTRARGREYPRCGGPSATFVMSMGATPLRKIAVSRFDRA